MPSIDSRLAAVYSSDFERGPDLAALQEFAGDSAQKISGNNHAGRYSREQRPQPAAYWSATSPPLFRANQRGGLLSVIFAPVHLEEYEKYSGAPFSGRLIYGFVQHRQRLIIWLRATATLLFPNKAAALGAI